VQHVPLVLRRDSRQHASTSVVAATEPLRRTLRRQVETGRILPQFEEGKLIPALEFYTYLTGNPFVAELPERVRRQYVATYQRDYNPKVFDELYSEQLEAIEAGRRLEMAVYAYFRRFTGAPFRKANGDVWRGQIENAERSGPETYLRVEEVEDFLRKGLSTKQSDSTPIKLGDGELSAWELLFLMPKRALGDSKDLGLCDITRYCAVGRMDRQMMTHALATGKSKQSSPCMVQATKIAP